MPKRPPDAPKLQALRQHGTLNLHPQAVTDELFVSEEFFDARDLVQVKYEMLRRVENDRAGTGAESKKTAEAGVISTPHQQLTAHYEQLRNDVLSLAAARNPAPGLALLLHQGMAAWMRAWSPCIEKRGPETPSQSVSSPYCPLDIRGRVANILAGIILNRQREAST